MLKNIIKEILLEVLTEATAEEPQNKKEAKSEVDFIGRSVLIRAHRMGVQIGIVDSVSDQFIKLLNSRKMWRWECDGSIALESFVKNGARAEGTRPTEIVESVIIRCDDVCGIIELTDERYREFMSLPASEQN